MAWDNIVGTQTEDEFFEDYVREALACVAPRMPDQERQIGPVFATWFECRPGEAFICTRGGSGDDRVLAQTIIREELRPYGIKQAGFTFDWDKNDPLRKEADWDDVQAKAVRLIQSGSVHLTRNGDDQVQGNVDGDHGNYDVWFTQQDPANPDVITQWECGCPWDQYAWGRTRQWKKYEGRVCSHALALYWASKGVPKDEAAHPANNAANPNQQSLFTMPGGGAPSGFGTPMKAGPQAQGAPQGQQMAMPGMMPMMSPAAMPAGQAPQPADVIPPFPMQPMDPALMPNPASVPGLRQPSPTNPTQYPGGTFSHVEAEWSGERLSADFTNGKMVATKYEDWGEWVGRSEEHGAGQAARIPANSPGEVLGQDPTGMVQVLFMNQATGVNEHGRMQPWGISGWFMPSELYDSSIKAPGPAIQRRR